MHKVLIIVQKKTGKEVPGTIIQFLWKMRLFHGLRSIVYGLPGRAAERGMEKSMPTYRVLSSACRSSADMREKAPSR
jgi:hypothetical protein